MTLKTKILGILLFLVCTTAAMDFAVHRWVIYPNFAAMEMAQARKDLAHYADVLHTCTTQLSALADDWAAGRDALRMVAGPGGPGTAPGASPRTFLDHRLNLIAYYDATGRLLKGRAFDPNTRRAVPIQDFSTLCPGAPGNAFPGLTGRPADTIKWHATAHGPMLIAARAVRAGGHHGQVKGFLVLGRLLGMALPDRPAFRIQAHHQAWPLDGDHLDPDEREAASKITPRSPVYLRTDKAVLQAYATIPDVSGVPALLIRVDIPRKESSRGRTALRYAGMSDVLVSGVFLIVLFGLLQRTVIRPICALRHHAESLPYGNGHPAGCSGQRRDEIGALCRQFDSMRQRLRSMRRDLLREVNEHRRSQEILDTYHARLRRLSSELLLAQEGERRRIAVDLHDRIGQSLTISKMKLDALCVDQPDGRRGAALRQISGMLEGAIAEARALSFELSPPILYDFGLAAALEWLAEKFGREHALQISVDAQADDDPGGMHLRIMLFQAARELLFNVIKHAHARTVAIRMTRAGRALKISIADDGRGFVPDALDPGRVEKAGFGLFSIRERLNDLEGRLDIDSVPGQGTCATLRCPLPRDDRTAG